LAPRRNQEEMKKGAVVCNQRARFFFYFVDEGQWGAKEKTPMQKFTSLQHIGPEDIRALKDALTLRMERIAQMVEVLTTAHKDWAITAKKDYILLETMTLDFKVAVKLLTDHGFTGDEFVLASEYSRKWGMI